MRQREVVGASRARAIVQRIRDNASDPEAAHIYEDDLRGDVLRTIADYSNDPFCVELAKIALSTDEIEFSRWCA